MRARLLSAVAVGALLLAGCGDDGGGPSVEAASDVDPGALTGTAATVDGGTVELGDYADRDLVVWFWAPW